MSGESQGFSGGEPLATPPDPVPVCTTEARYVWLASRQVAVTICPQSGEVIVASGFSRIDRSQPRIAYTPGGQWLPLEMAPSVVDCIEDLLRACQSACAQRMVCHSRPQAIVFDAGNLDEEGAADWVDSIACAGVGQQIEELRMPAGLGYWQLRGKCALVARSICGEDIVDATGWTPPDQQAGEASHPPSPTHSMVSQDHAQDPTESASHPPQSPELSAMGVGAVPPDIQMSDVQEGGETMGACPLLALNQRLQSLRIHTNPVPAHIFYAAATFNSDMNSGTRDLPPRRALAPSPSPGVALPHPMPGPTPRRAPTEWHENGRLPSEYTQGRVRPELTQAQMLQSVSPRRLELPRTVAQYSPQVPLSQAPQAPAEEGPTSGIWSLIGRGISTLVALVRPLRLPCASDLHYLVRGSDPPD